MLPDYHNPLIYATSLTCNGQRVLWPLNHSTYPWQLHNLPDNKKSRTRLQDVYVAPDWYSNEHIFVRSRACIQVLPDFLAPSCVECSKAAEAVSQRAEAASSNNERIPNIYRSWDTIHTLCTFYQEQNSALKRSLNKLQEKLNRHDAKHDQDLQIIEFLATHDAPRIRHTLAKALHRKAGSDAIIDVLTEAVIGTYRPERDFRPWEIDLALLVLRLGGHRLLYALNKVFCLPSARTLQKYASSFPSIQYCISLPDLETMVQNLITIVLRPRQHLPPSKNGVIIMLDETALNPAPVYNRELNAIGGICGEATAGCIELLSAKSMENIEILAQAVANDPGPNNKNRGFHLGREATSAAVGFLGRQDHAALPFLLSAICGHKKAEHFVDLLAQIYEAWNLSGCENHMGSIRIIDIDGDGSRRKGGNEVMLQHNLRDVDTEAWQLLCSCLGLDLRVGPGGSVLEFDWKHILKRELSLFCSCSHLIVVRHKYIFTRDKRTLCRQHASDPDATCAVYGTDWHF
jgi:hypothetical protein